jgi:hypothetical protein
MSDNPCEIEGCPREAADLDRGRAVCMEHGEWLRGERYPEPVSLSFHAAWGEAKSRPDYDKRRWMVAQRTIDHEQHLLSEWLDLLAALDSDRVQMEGWSKL